MSTITIPTAPHRSPTQRFEALAIANDVRQRRAAFKVRLKVGDASASGMLADPPAWAETMKVYDLLLAVPRVGRVKVLKWLHAAEASPSKTLGGLSQRQRSALLQMVWAWERR